ncbi:MAG: hypothetical protein HZB16_14400 [Armatimonadetes bacterium]|nr:hypothetical protein [Armatimonadota bacterium]
MPPLASLLLLNLLAPAVTPLAPPGDVTAWDSARDTARLAREFTRYDIAAGEALGHGKVVDWAFGLKEGAFADLFLRRPISEPFGKLRLVLRNEGAPLTLCVKLGEASDSEWTGPRVSLPAGGDWQTVDLPLGRFEVASWTKDRDGRLDFPTRYLAVIAFDVKPGPDYKLRIAEVSLVEPTPVAAKLEVTGLPAAPAMGAKVEARFALTMAGPWSEESGSREPALGLAIAGQRPRAITIDWDKPAARWQPGQTVQGTARFALSQWQGGVGEWRLLAPGLRTAEGNVISPVTVPVRRPGPISAAVRSYHGAPSLFINDKPVPAVAYAAYGPTPQVFSEFGGAGVRLFTICGTPTASGYGLSVDSAKAPGVWDFGQLDERLRMVLDSCPDGYVFPRLYLSAPEWWLDQHPEAVVSYDPGDGKPKPFAQPYADHVIGYHLASGTTEEWMMWGANDDQWTDYCADGVAAWQAYRRKLGRPVVPIPTRAERAKSVAGTLRDPASDQASIDYSLFLADTAADTIEHFAATVKRISGRKLTTGVFYGYLLQLFGQRQQNAAHLAFDRVVRCPDVDFMCSPTSYAFRLLGTGTSHFMAPVSSVTAHGKLWFDENDIRTSLAPGAEGEWGRPANVAGDKLQQDRELANVLTNGVGQWWFDVGRNRYDDPELMAHLAKLREVATTAFAADRSPVDQVALVVDSRGLARVNVGDMLMHHMMLEQVPTLARIGAPVGHYDLSDVALLRRHRLIVFAPLYDPTPAQRAAIEQLKGDGRVLVFLHAPAPYRDGAWQPTGMSAMCGLQLKLEDRTVTAKVSYAGTDPLVAGVAGGYGNGMALRPAVVGADPQATVLGTLPDGSPGLLVRRYPTWTAVWSAAPNLPTDLLVRLAEAAKVHRYVTGPDVVWASRDLLAVSVKDGGTRHVTLPAPAKVTNLYSGKVLTTGGREFDVDLPASGTVLLRVERQGRSG